MNLVGWKFWAFLGALCWAGSLLTRITGDENCAVITSWTAGGVLLIFANHLRATPTEQKP